MFKVIIFLTTGAVLGWILRNRKFAFVDGLISKVILLLLFFLGVTVGNNDMIMNNLSSIGLDALIITAGALLGSVTVAWALYHLIFKNR